MNVPLSAAGDPRLLTSHSPFGYVFFSIRYPFFNTLPAALTDKPGDFIIPSFLILSHLPPWLIYCVLLHFVLFSGVFNALGHGVLCIDKA